MSLTSTELNYLIWRYLQELGFELAAFALEKQASPLTYESSNASTVSRIEPGCLVNLVQKGILYLLAQESGAKDDRLTLFGTLLQEEIDKRSQNGKVIEMNNNHNNNNNVKDNDKLKAKEEKPSSEDTVMEVPFTTKELHPSIHFDISVTCDWHPTIDVYAYGKGTNAIINAVKGDTIADSISINHLTVNPVDINLVSWAPQGNTIVTASVDGQIRAWSPDGKLLNIGSSEFTHISESSSPILELIWSESGQFLLTIDNSLSIYLYDGTNLNQLKQVAYASSSIVDAIWISEFKFVVSFNNTVKVFSVTPLTYELQSIGSLYGHEKNVNKLSLDSISKLLASSSEDFQIKIWTNGLSQESLDVNLLADGIYTHTSTIIDMLWLHHNDTPHLLTLSMEGLINIWDGKSGKNILSNQIFKNSKNFEGFDNVDQFSDSIIFVSSISPDKKVLAIGNDYGAVSLWDVNLENYLGENGSTSFRCLGVYNPSTLENSEESNVGICDLKWDSKSSKVCVSYQGRDSIIIDWKV